MQFVASKHMEARYGAKMRELGDCRHQIVFHGTDERANVDSILGSGFDKSRVRRVRRGLSPAWTSSSFDKVLKLFSSSACGLNCTNTSIDWVSWKL